MLARSVLLHRLGLVAIALIACRGGTGVPGRPLAPAGASDGRKPTDDGGGELARLSMGFRRDKADDLATTPPPPQETYDDTVGLGSDGLSIDPHAPVTTFAGAAPLHVIVPSSTPGSPTPTLYFGARFGIVLNAGGRHPAYARPP